MQPETKEDKARRPTPRETKEAPKQEVNVNVEAPTQEPSKAE